MRLTYLRLLGVRDLRRRWDRTLLVVASIALGVATLVSARVLNRALEDAARAGNAPLSGGGDLLVSNGDPGVPLGVAAELRTADLPGVTGVTPLVVGRVTLPALGDHPAVLVGADFGDAAGAGPAGVTFTRTLPADLASAGLLLTRVPVVLSRPLHDALPRAGPDAPLVVRYGSERVACQPVGFFEVDETSPLAAAGRSVIALAVADAARLVHPGPPRSLMALAGGVGSDALFPPRVDRIDVTVRPGHDLDAVQQAVQRVVGGRGTARRPDQHHQGTQEVVGGVQVGFTLCSLGAMVVGLFLVYNAMSVTVAERWGEVGVLRALGATRPQVVLVFAAAAGAAGLAGAVLGVPLGTGAARLVLWAFRDELGGLVLGAHGAGLPSPGTVGLALLAGVGTALLAGLVPALQAASDPPAEAARRSPRPRLRWQLLHAAGVLLLVGGGLALILLRDELPARVGSFGGMMGVLVGMLLAAPLFAAGLVRLVQPVLRSALPLEARLAADNLLRAPGRTGVVIAALAAGVGVMVQTAGVGRSNREPVLQWLDEVIRADQMVFAGSLADAVGQQSPLEPRLATGLAALPGVEGAFGVRYRSPEFNGTVVFLTALDVREYLRLTGPRLPGGLQGFAALEQLDGSAAGTVVSENFARRHRVNVGDAVELPGPAGSVRLTVLATMPDYSWSRGTLFLDRAAYARLFRDDRLDVVHVFERTADAADAVKRFADAEGLVVQGRATMRAFVADLIDRVFLLAYLQQLVVGLVAGLGVVTALLISVLQRKRELGLLLAVGATPAQVVRAVLWEAALMGTVGTLLGAAVGLPLEWYILRVVLAEESGFLLPVLVPWRAGAGIAAGSVLAATLAGLLPAWKAVRTRIPEAVQYE